jgi:hypothetical protein
VLLLACLLALGFDVWTIEVLGTATLLGSALARLRSAPGAIDSRSAGCWLAAPLVACGLLKLGDDITLWLALRKQRLDER